MLFQFHKGTIKAGSEEEQNVLLTYFNSIKVQLKLRAASLWNGAL